MATLLVQGLVLFVLLEVPAVSLLNTSDQDLQAVLVALEKLVAYYDRNHQQINLDGLFGLRVIEGQLQLLISEHNAGSHQHLSRDVIDKIVYLKSAAQNASVIGVQSVRRQDSKYFLDFSVMISSPWTLMKQRNKLQASLRWEIPQYKAKMKVKLIEEMSDRCMTELMRSGSGACEISDACVQIMTTRGLTGYGITHQILWSVVGEIMPNCRVPIDKVLSLHSMGNISMFQQELCTNNFYEMVAVVHVLMHGKVHESHQDLFLEQQFICPNLGFYEFMKKDYLDQILSWQFPSGCFGEHEPAPADESDLDLASLLEGYHDSVARIVPELSKLDGHDSSDVINIKISNTVDSKHKADISKAKIVDPNVKLNQNDLQDPNLFQKAVIRVPRHATSVKASASKLQQNSVNNQAQNKMFPINQENKNISLYVKKSVNPVLSEHHYMYSYGKEMRNNIQHGDHMSVNAVENSSFALSNKSKSPLSNDNRRLPNKKDTRNHAKGGQQHTGATNNFRDFMSRRRNENLEYVSQHNTKTQRHLLLEKELEGGCLSHKTGVGSGALVMYLRYLIEPGNINWTGQHELFLSDSRNLLQATGEGKVVGAGEEANQGNEEDEEEEEEDEEEDENEEKFEQQEDTLNEAVNYSEGNDMEVGDDQGDDDYNEEQADNNADGASKAVRAAHVGTNHEANSVVINEDVGKGSKIVPDARKETALDDDEEDLQEEDHNYYDDEGETEKGIIRRRKPHTSRPHLPVKIRRKHSEHPASKEPLYGQEPELFVPDHPNYAVILFVSVAPFFILFIFLFKFIRKRRVHIRYYF